MYQKMGKRICSMLLVLLMLTALLPAGAFAEGVCSETGGEHEHAYCAEGDGRGKHTDLCIRCGEAFTENCTYEDGFCVVCGDEEPLHEHSFVYASNNDGTHNVSCSGCDYAQSSIPCEYGENGLCVCGAAKEETLPDCRVSVAIASTNSSFTVPYGCSLDITWEFITENGVPKGWIMVINGTRPEKNSYGGYSWTSDTVKATSLAGMAAMFTQGRPQELHFAPTKEQCRAGAAVALTIPYTKLTEEQRAFDIVFVDRDTGEEAGKYENYHASETYGKFEIRSTDLTIRNYVTKNLDGYRIYIGGATGSTDRQITTLLVGENGVSPKTVTMYVEVNHSTTSDKHVQPVKFLCEGVSVWETAVPLTNAYTGSYSGAKSTIELDMRGMAEQLKNLGYAYDEGEPYTVQCDNYTHEPAVTEIQVVLTCIHELDVNSAADQGDGTHTGYCWNCGEEITEAHRYDEDGFCTVCFAEHDHELIYTDMEDGEHHTVTCTGCPLKKEERHEDEDVCACGYKRPVPDCDFEYTIEDGKVTVTKYIGAKTQVEIPETIEDLPVTAVGESCFAWNNSVTEVTVAGNVESIGSKAFYNCQALASVTIGSSVKTIGSDAFGFCKALTEVTIPDSVESIGSEAFAYCDGLKTVRIGSGLKTMGAEAFYWDEGLERFIVSEANPNYSSDGEGVLFNKNKTVLIQYPLGKKDESYTVPEGVLTIGGSSFAWVKNLKQVVMPGSVTAIEEKAFSYSNIESVAFGSGLKTIGSAAFEYCGGLTALAFPEGLAAIGDSAFYKCTGLTELVLPESVRSIGKYAFQSCVNVKRVVIGYGIETIGDGAFTGGNFGNENFMHLEDFTLKNPDIEITGYMIDFDPRTVLHGWCGSTLQKLAGTVRPFEVLEPDGDIDLNRHEWDEGVVTAQPSCTEEGKLLQTCAKCGAEQVSAIPALGHKTELQNTKAASCTEPGYTGDEVCTVCGETVKKGEAIEAAGHSWGEWTVIKEATTEKTGTEQRTCGVCGEQQARETAKLDPKAPPKTGDDGSVYLWSGVFMLSAIGIALVLTADKKQKHKGC